MNYYIDFDNTLYNTPLLTKSMLDTISKSIASKENTDEKIILEECKSMFNREHIYDIYELVKYFSNKYNLDPNPITDSINKVILNSSNFVYDDSVRFLEKLRNQKHNIFLLSCHSTGILDYQVLKIKGSGLVKYFDALYITLKTKYELDINFKNGIFIDDKPEDLIGLYSKNAKKVIRIRRNEATYSKIDIQNEEIEEYSSLDELI